MVRPDKITSALFGGVGFKDSTLSSVPSLTDSNKENRSGMVFQDADFLVTLKNIFDTQENSGISTPDFNTLLENMQKAVILEAVNKVAEEQSDFIQTENIYPYEKAFENTVTPSGKAVGFKIDPTIRNGYICEIPWIELSFDSAKTFKVYLYNSNIPTEKIEEESVTTIAGRSVIKNLNWYIADDTDYKGGDFYLIYFEDDLDGAKAFKKDFELSKYRIDAEYYYVHPVALDHSGATIDVTSLAEKSDTFGLNLGINVYNDYTEIFTRNGGLMWAVIKHQMTEKVLNLISTSSRTNDTERGQQARLQLYGSKEHGIEGIYSKLNRAVRDTKKMLFYQPRIYRGTLKS